MATGNSLVGYWSAMALTMSISTSLDTGYCYGQYYSQVFLSESVLKIWPSGAERRGNVNLCDGECESGVESRSCLSHLRHHVGHEKRCDDDIYGYALLVAIHFVVLVARHTGVGDKDVDTLQFGFSSLYKSLYADIIAHIELPDLDVFVSGRSPNIFFGSLAFEKAVHSEDEISDTHKRVVACCFLSKAHVTSCDDDGLYLASYIPHLCNIMADQNMPG